MLTRLFGQSKPINFILVAILMSIFYVIANASYIFSAETTFQVIEKIALLLLFVLSMVILNFVAKKNDLNKVNSFKIIVYACFTICFFSLLQSNAVITANFFLILGFRRLISLKTNKDIEKKIFDATFWVCIASLFQFWCILFVFVIYLGILFHTNRHWKKFTMPIIAFLCIFIIATTFTLFKQDAFFLMSDWFQASSFNFSKVNSLRILIPISFIVALLIWVTVFYFKAIQKSSISQKPSMYLIFFTLLTGILVAVLSPTKDGSELIFLFAPLAIMTAKYFEREKELWFKEILLALLILLPILTPIFF